jgi:hypothetical protein
VSAEHGEGMLAYSQINDHASSAICRDHHWSSIQGLILAIQKHVSYLEGNSWRTPNVKSWSQTLSEFA